MCNACTVMFSCLRSNQVNEGGTSGLRHPCKFQMSFLMFSFYSLTHCNDMLRHPKCVGIRSAAGHSARSSSLVRCSSVASYTHPDGVYKVAYHSVNAVTAQCSTYAHALSECSTHCAELRWSGCSICDLVKGRLRGGAMQGSP